jgi:alkylhydroperoxidase/carboxymuconolactone decarboxylase family protein YurZ
MTAQNMNYFERLRRLAINDAHLAEDLMGSSGVEAGSTLDPKTLTLVRLAALVAIRGAQPSFGALTDGAVEAGATADEIVDVLAAVAAVVGLPCVVAAAPKVAIALGHDVDEALAG